MSTLLAVVNQESHQVAELPQTETTLCAQIDSVRLFFGTKFALYIN